MLHRLFERRAPQPAEEQRSYSMAQLGLARWADPSGAPSVTDPYRALTHAAVWACVSIKAKNIASLPVDEVRYVTQGGRRVREPMPQSQVIRAPSAIVSRRGWTHQIAHSLFTDGNAFGLVVAESAGRPTQIELMDPSQVHNRRLEDGRKAVDVLGVTHEAYPFGDLWHVPGEMLAAGSPFGLSPVEHAGRAVGTALKAEDFGGGFFARGGIPSAILAPERDPGEEGAKALKAAFMRAAEGREPAVLPQSVTYERIAVDPNDSQFIDLMRFEIEQVCRFFGVPPSMVYAAVSGQNVTYANVTDADLQFLKHTLSYPIDLLEDALSDLLPAPRVARFNRDAILRADTAKRYQAHQMALQNRWRTVNEVRTLEDEQPFDDPAFDEPGIPGVGTPPPMADDDAEGGDDE